jgi:hypothetical protein
MTKNTASGLCITASANYRWYTAAAEASVKNKGSSIAAAYSVTKFIIIIAMY